MWRDLRGYLLRRGYSAVAGAGDCSLRISDGTGSGNGLTDIGQIYNFDLPATSNYDVTVHVTGAAEKSAGTYNVQLRCSENSGSLQAVKAEMVVFAVAS